VRFVSIVMSKRRVFSLLPVASLLVTTAATAQPPANAPPPPPPAQPAAQPTANTEQTAPKKEIDPKKEFLWFDAEAGIQSANLSTFNQNFQEFSVGFLPRSGVGPTFGGAVGIRIVFLTLGARGRVTRFEDGDGGRNVQDWTMSSLDGEVGLRVPLGRVEPYMILAAGYTTFGGFGQAVRGARSGLNVNGFNARAGFGVDYYFTRTISVGGLASAEVLGLSRPGVPLREVTALPASQTLDTAATRFLLANGSTWGTSIGVSGGLKLHF
jgi:hypothetical protein